MLHTQSRDSQARSCRRELRARCGQRVRVATLAAYAIRSKIVHGQWARNRDDRRAEADAAEQWLWQLVEREVEIRLTDMRLDPIQAHGLRRFGA